MIISIILHTKDDQNWHTKLENLLSICENLDYFIKNINKKKSAVMIIGSKMKPQSFNLDQFSLNLERDKIELVNRAKCLG